VALSPYGAICKAASQNPGTRLTASMWSVMADLARERVGGTIHPLLDINDQDDVTTSELVALLNRAADMIDPNNTEPRPSQQSRYQIGPGPRRQRRPPCDRPGLGRPWGTIGTPPHDLGALAGRRDVH